MIRYAITTALNIEDINVNELDRPEDSCSITRVVVGDKNWYYLHFGTNATQANKFAIETAFSSKLLHPTTERIIQVDHAGELYLCGPAKQVVSLETVINAYQARSPEATQATYSRMITQIAQLFFFGGFDYDFHIEYNTTNKVNNVLVTVPNYYWDVFTDTIDVFHAVATINKIQQFDGFFAFFGGSDWVPDIMKLQKLNDYYPTTDGKCDMWISNVFQTRAQATQLLWTIISLTAIHHAPPKGSKAK